MEEYNFCSGPATLPEEVYQKLQQELTLRRGSVFESSHREKRITAIARQCEEGIRALMNISEDYAVLFLAGGATGQFSAVPLNLMTEKRKASFLDTGIWSQKAIKEAENFGAVEVAASSRDSGYTSVVHREDWQISSDVDYFHYTPNETIQGVEVSQPVLDCTVPVVADMSSIILARPVNVDNFGVIYAGAQKNLGIAGITLVIVRRDLLERQRAHAVPRVWDYSLQAQEHSMLNTPPVTAWYVLSLVVQWMLDRGGIQKIYEDNQYKARLLYDYIDRSSFYSNDVDKEYRSLVNIPFLLKDSGLEATFLAESKSQGLFNLKGHRIVGGLRASIYNAMPLKGVEALVTFMQGFEKKYA